MKQRSFLQSLNDAAEGFIHVVKSERNMRIHFLLAFLVLLFAVVIDIGRVEWILLGTVISLVLVAEMVNTAVEELTDLVKDSFHPAARVIKDISAGMVLVAVLNALVAGYFIFSRYLSWPLYVPAWQVRRAAWTLAFVSVLIVVFCVVGLKAFWKRGTPFRGGAISGHSAIAFSLWTAILYSTTNKFVIGISFVIALLVAQSRLRSKIHSFWEAFAGAILGIAVTSVLFLLFR